MQLRDRLEQTDAQMKERERELDNSCRELNEKAFALSEVQRECERYQTNVVHLESQIREADYKQTNFDRVKSERDQLERECAHLRHSESLIEASLTNCQKDRDSAQHELLARQQTLALLTQDKEYLTRQVQDLTGRCHHAEERADSLNGQLLESKKAREDLYEKFVVSREQSKSEYERKLSDEIQKLRSQTAVELDQVRTSLKDMYERENRSLHEARDLAVSEKENAVQSLHESQAKVEQLSLQMRHLQLQLDSKTGELHSDLRLKSFETEKAQMLLEEQSINLKKLCMENDKLKEKLEVLTREFYTLQSSSDKHIAELENECCQRAEKLGSYEKVERELDEVVMQAAEVSDNGEAERVLFSYGYGANVPSTAKRRLQQSVHLAQRVLQLERDNTSLRQEVEQGQDDYKQLQDELAESRQHLDESRQPYSYLIESMKSRDEQIKVQRLKMESLENEVRRLNAERSELVRSKNLMSADLERLLSQREEMAVMRQLLGGLHNQRSYPSRTTDVHGASSTAVHMPPPTVLSRRDPPDWYRRLKQMSAPVKLKGR
ncbi:progesterone-induced-blocking factor 1-like [Corticium candelabrum]|uniref:progesterone-induced-blocking factor 1-like n=1 Tax=Corticium candelabrum TaxID=121492 RepID=UPI002E2686D9|nr:progesterone-induced-blocking factor 1-like [Corticium candelabrum]